MRAVWPAFPVLLFVAASSGPLASASPSVDDADVGLVPAATSAAAADPEEPPPPPPPKPAKRRPAPDDKRRTLKSYGSNLKYNFMGVVTPGNRMPLLVTGALTLPALAWDDTVVDYFRQHPHKHFGQIGQTMGGTIAVSGLAVGLFSAGRVARGDRFRATTYDLSQAIIVNGIWTQALKLAFRRERPDHSNRVSFPSGHASDAFTAATVIAHHYRWAAVPAYGVATYIAVSRLAANKHYISDVVAGAGFGFGVGRLVVRRNGRPPNPPAATAPAVSLMPGCGAGGACRGLTLAVSF